MEARYALGTALMRLGRTEEGTMHIEEFRRLQAEAAISERRTYQLERLKRDAAVSIARSEITTRLRSPCVKRCRMRNPRPRRTWPSGSR